MMKIKASSVAAIVTLLCGGVTALAENPFRHDPPPPNYCPNGLCIPNAQNSGYYPTVWRRWPGLPPINNDKELNAKPTVAEETAAPPEKKPTKESKEPTVERPSDEDDTDEFAPTKPKEATPDEIPGRTKPPVEEPPPGTERPKGPDANPDDIFQNLSPFEDEPAAKSPSGASLRRPRLDLGNSTRRKVSEFQGGKVQRVPGRKGVTIISPASHQQLELAQAEAAPAIDLQRGGEIGPEYTPTEEVRELTANEPEEVKVNREAPAEEPALLSSRRSSAALRPAVSTQRTTATLDDAAAKERPLTKAKNVVERAGYIEANPLRSEGSSEKVHPASWTAAESGNARAGLEQPSTNPLRR